MQKTLIFPGWMSRVKNYQLGDGFELWQEVINPDTHFQADCLIGHSLGANFALLNWQANKKVKLILINPIILKKSLLGLFIRWLWYVSDEGLIISRKDLKSNRLFFGLKTGLGLLKHDYVKIIREIPKENLFIIRGGQDKYFCDQETADFVRSENIRLIEIDGLGHNWDENFKKAVQVLLSEWQKH